MDFLYVKIIIQPIFHFLHGQNSATRPVSCELMYDVWLHHPEQWHTLVLRWKTNNSAPLHLLIIARYLFVLFSRPFIRQSQVSHWNKNVTITCICRSGFFYMFANDNRSKVDAIVVGILDQPYRCLVEPSSSHSRFGSTLVFLTQISTKFIFRSHGLWN